MNRDVVITFENFFKDMFVLSNRCSPCHHRLEMSSCNASTVKRYSIHLVSSTAYDIGVVDCRRVENMQIAFAIAIAIAIASNDFKHGFSIDEMFVETVVVVTACSFEVLENKF